jgi:UDP-glucose 4-epimerase
MSKVLVTGASGLIGSRIIRTLAERGMDVVGTARSSSEKLCQELGVPVRQLDVLSPHSNALAGLQAECLIHCATANDIVSKVPAHGMNLTVNGTWNVLELARTLGISRFIFFSTFQVFGTELSGIVDESRPPCCESAYGLNHWFGEEVCRMFASKYPMDIAAVRPSNVYGAPLASSVHRESLVPTCFVQSAIRSGEIVLHSSGRQRRNFISTEEVAQGCAYLVDNLSRGFEIINLCSAYNASIREIAQITAEVFEQRFDRPLPIHSRSANPLCGNEFAARSKLRFLWNSPEHSAESMRTAIARLFDGMSARLPLVTAS